MLVWYIPKAKKLNSDEDEFRVAVNDFSRGSYIFGARTAGAPLVAALVARQER